MGVTASGSAPESGAPVRLTLSVCPKDGLPQPVHVAVRQVLLAGYTGRDRAHVMAHIRELASLGVAAPERVPAIYVVEPALLTTASSVRVTGTDTSGEAEFFVVSTPQGLLVGVGSDHTDRAHEAISVDEAKAMCPKPISREAWRHEDVAGHWDRLELRSWVTDAQGRRLYQEGCLVDLLDVEHLLAELASSGHADLEERIVFGGTLPAIGGLGSGHRFEVELRDPVLDRRLSCAYDIVQAGQAR